MRYSSNTMKLAPSQEHGKIKFILSNRDCVSSLTLLFNASTHFCACLRCESSLFSIVFGLYKIGSVTVQWLLFQKEIMIVMKTHLIPSCASSGVFAAFKSPVMLVICEGEIIAYEPCSFFKANALERGSIANNSPSWTFPPVVVTLIITNFSSLKTYESR